MTKRRTTSVIRASYATRAADDQSQANVQDLALADLACADLARADFACVESCP